MSSNLEKRIIEYLRNGVYRDMVFAGARSLVAEYEAEQAKQKKPQ